MAQQIDYPTTHGEVWYANKQKLENSKKLEVDEKLNRMQLPQKMNNEDAANYYNAKLFKYWMTQLNSTVKKERKKQIISALMFGHTDAYKKHKELEDV